MKRFLLSQFIILFAIISQAQIAEGYYRIQNKVTSRYITVWDNTFTVNVNATDADLSALVTIRSYNRIINDPGSIIYIKRAGEGYTLKAQGADTYNASNGRYIKITPKGDAYRAHITENGLTKYLCDEYDPKNEFDESYVFTSDKRTFDWYIKPINDTDNYMGLTPTITDGTHYYQTLYTSFPFSFATKEIKAYKISKADEGMAVIEEITGEIPAATPILIKSTSNVAATNKLNILVSSSATVSGNKLKGNYFDYARRKKQTPYVAATMRVLGKSADGSICFVKDNTLKNLPKNSAYLPVPENCPDNVRIVTKTEYDSIIAIKKANETAYTRLTKQIAAAQSALDEAKETIATDCKDVAHKFTASADSIQNIITAIKADVDAKYNATSLNAGSKIETAEITAAISEMKEAAIKAQDEYNKTTSIDGIEEKDLEITAIYTLSGKKVEFTESGNVYIVVYSDGRAVKRVVKE